jgi:hypothetical protein
MARQFKCLHAEQLFRHSGFMLNNTTLENPKVKESSIRNPL